MRLPFRASSPNNVATLTGLGNWRAAPLMWMVITFKKHSVTVR
jgi:hypothetical protein